jgi:fused signal recognition particle receptor
LSYLWQNKNLRANLERSRRSWFAPLARLLGNQKNNEVVWEEVEELLLGADVGIKTTETLLERVRERMDGKKMTSTTCLDLLKEEMVSILPKPLGNLGNIHSKNATRTQVYLVVGVNGVGKTTTIGKLASMFRADDKTVIIGAADTYRAAAIEQIQILGNKVGAVVVAHQSGADPGAVAYDAYQAALARHVDVLIIDTAGRLHTNLNLMEEIKKIQRVISRLDPEAPHHSLLVLDATVGQNGLTQAQGFIDAIGCTGIILTKLDGTARGGIVLNICNQLDLPVLFIGTGESMEDLAPFDANNFVDSLFETEPQV